MKKETCTSWFSETIRETTKKMGAEKTRPQIIAISAKRTIKMHPECKRYLERRQERIWLDEGHWIYWSSKSFRLYRESPCAIRVFFSKRKPPSSQWKKSLREVIHDRLGVVFRIKKEESKDNYMEIPMDNARLIMSLLSHRVAGFLD